MIRWTILWAVLLMSTVAWAREVGPAERQMIEQLHAAASQQLSGGSFRGLSICGIYRPSLQGDSRASGIDFLREWSRENFREILRAEDLVYLRKKGITNLSAGMEDPTIRQRVEQRIEEFVAAHGEEILILKKPWVRTWRFSAAISRDNKRAWCRRSLLRVDGSPKFYNPASDQELVGIAESGACTMYSAGQGKARRMRFGLDRAAAMKYLLWQPHPAAAGLADVQYLDAEDIRVLDEHKTEDGLAIRVLISAGEEVTLLSVLPNKDYRVCLARTYRNGRLTVQQQYGKWVRLARLGTWYPLHQRYDRVTDVQMRQELEYALRNGQISLTNLKLLENQQPSAWFRYERQIEQIDLDAVDESLFELKLPPGVEIEDTIATSHVAF